MARIEVPAVVEITVQDSNGHPIEGAEVSLYNAANGHLSVRYSDGGGYTNHGLLGAPGDLCTFTSNGYRIVGNSNGAAEGPQYYRFTAEPDQRILLTYASFRRPAREFPRYWQANMCGMRLDYLPSISGGARQASLLMTWLDHRYDLITKTRARRDYLAIYTHYLKSWPDSRDDGFSPQDFAEDCGQVLDLGGHVCVMLSAKPTSSGGVRNVHDTLSDILRVLPALIRRGVRGFCVGWELSLWLSPADVQFLIDALAPIIVAAGGRLYVHLQQGYGSFQSEGKFFADFWNVNVGKLTGILRQEILRQSPQQKRYDSGGVVDVLLRFCGYFGVVTDSGFGHPFDDVELEISAQDQFDGSVSETQGDALGQWAIDTPAQTGPTGITVRVMGSGNGRLRAT